jgi:hypothetical protein
MPEEPKDNSKQAAANRLFRQEEAGARAMRFADQADLNYASSCAAQPRVGCPLWVDFVAEVDD